jgi:hypothetical protein
MADSDKNIIISPQRGSTTLSPNIVFTGKGNDPITLRVTDADTGALNFEGSEGQLFGISNSLTTGKVFSANFVSGIPAIDVDASGLIRLAPLVGSVSMGGNVGIGTTTPATKLAVSGETSVGQGRKLSFIGLDINSQATPSYIKIKTTIPAASAAADFTVTIKGFRYGNAENLNIDVSWHWYQATFWNPSVTSYGSWAPVVRLSNEAGLVCITLTSPGYWPKLYVESMYSSAYTDTYATGWTWVDEDAAGINITTLGYKSNFGNEFVMKSNGNVGIGTADPSTKLHVYGNTILVQESAVGTALHIRDNSIENYNIANDEGQVAINYAGLGAGFNNFRNFNVYNGKGGLISTFVGSTGYVGIGTNSPSSRLAVNGYITESTDSGTTYWNVVTQQDIGTSPNQLPLNQYLGQLAFLDDVAPNSLRRDGGSTDDVYVDSSGRVGIGTINPTAKLYVNGEIYNTSSVRTQDLKIRGRIDPYTSVSETGSGAMSIFGHNAMTSYFVNNQVVAPNGSWYGHFVRMYYSEGIAFHTSGPVNAGAILYDNSNPSNVVAGSGERMRITSNGNVGIGTTNPQVKLDVHGDIYLDSSGGITDRYIYFRNQSTEASIRSDKDLSLWSGNGGGSPTKYLTIAQGGNVGIGTTAPLQILDVRGKFLLAADATTSTHITQVPYTINNGTLSWEGSAGQLFSITNNLTSGSIFSVNDVSGIPSIDVDADGTISLAPFGGTVVLKQVSETVANNFNTVLAPSSGTLTIDVSLGTIVLGDLNASITTWAFTNFPTTNSRATRIMVIIDGDSGETYGDGCTVNGTAITGGIKWSNNRLPSVSTNFDTIEFIIIRDGAGTINVFGFSGSNFNFY